MHRLQTAVHKNGHDMLVHHLPTKIVHNLSTFLCTCTFLALISVTPFPMLSVLGDLEEPSGSKLNDLPLGVMMNIVYEAETPILTTPPATLCEAKTLASQKTSGIDEQSPEKEDLGASEDQLQCEKDPESTLCRPI